MEVIIMNEAEIAKVCHEANRAYCESLGDTSQRSWSEAEQWQRDSVIAGVIAHFRNPRMSAEQSHQEWCDYKTAAGWASGPVKDPAKKEHPCLVPYAKLPVEQRKKDVLFTAIIRALSGE